MRYHNIEKGEPPPLISQEQSLSSGTSLCCEKALKLEFTIISMILSSACAVWERNSLFEIR